ncbi:WxL domain-containing protein [Enterococcus faecalis]
MKQTKWQRLATIGLCSSLVINAFSGVTAVAETITIESSPTVASSAKEATSASSATQASTESSQETTETSREEVTQEIEKPEVVKEETERAKKESESSSILQRAVGQTFISGRNIPIFFVDEYGSLFDPESISLTANVSTLSDNISGGLLKKAVPVRNENGGKVLAVPSSATYSYETTNSKPRTIYGVTDVMITIPKRFENISIDPSSIYTGGTTKYPLPTGFINKGGVVTNQSESNVKNGLELTNQNTANPQVYRAKTVNGFNWGNGANASYVLGYLYGDIYGSTSNHVRRGTNGPIYYYLTNRRVTESFKNTEGTDIPAPTGFTQGKQTVIDSDSFTFKQAGTLPETYKASNGKTYKFKGWYKGKTKPNTLTTTKAPSYAVTYDDNDDLNVVYEEAFEFPEETFQFGFVNQDGQLVKSDDITIAYDYSRYLTSNGTTTWNGIDLNQKAITDGKLKKITMPKSSMPLHVGEAQSNGEAMINISFSLPKYYTGLNIYNKSGKIDSNYPLPPRHYYTNNQEVIGLVTDAIFPGWLTLAKAADNSYVYKEALTSPEPVNSSFPMMRRGVTGYTYYYSLDAPVYYHLTQRKVTENFVDATGAKITPPTGFTQGKQTGIDSDPYTFKQAGTLPDTYQAGGKTYKFKGWYKGKTKPNTLTTTKAPSYAVTYDDNDDLNVVYEEVNFPETTYQFGFVNEAGQLVNPDDINLTYDYKSIVYRGTGATGSTVSFGTIANNQSGVKVGNLRQVTLPAKNIAQPTVVGWNGEAFANFSIKLPKYYKSLNLYDKTGKIDSKYPLPVKTTVSSVSNDTVQPEANVIAELTLTQRADGSFTPREIYSGIDSSVRYPPFLRRTVSYSSSGSITALYQTISGPVYYHLTNRKVTENFVNTSGAKITPPAGFTQGKQTVINSDPYTFKQSGTLPDTYTTGGKTYKFKGWYKGKTKPNTLTTTKAPSYAVTYDGNDDLTVVYEEEAVTTLYPSLDVNFVDEKGVGFTPALTFSGKYRVQRTSDRLYTDLYDLTSKSKGSGQYTLSLNNGTMPLSPELLRVYGNDKPINGTNRLNFSLDKLAINQQLKYVNSIELDTVKSVMKMYGYNYTSGSATIIDPNQVPTEYNLSAGNIALLGFDTDGGYFSKESSGVFNILMGYASDGGKPLITMNLFSGNPVNASKLVYTVTRKQVTENFVDTNGTKITPPTGFTQGNQIPMTSNTFKYTSAKALPASYSVGGKTYIFQGWYKGKTKPNTLTTSTTPTYNTTFDGNDDMTAVYKEASISANLTMRGAVDVIDNGATMEYWEVLLKNTGEAPLTSVKIKPTTDWAAGISTPTELFILGTGQNTKVRPITKEQWEAGFEIPLDSSIPVGGQLTINLLGTKVTGQPNQVLKAAVEVTGNFNKLTASDTVRIKDLDQETKEPTGEGFISVPTFNFGQVGVAGSTQQHSLKKAADYYGNGTRNPYLRIKKTQPNWSLTAQLSQPKSATDSLPTATRLLLGAAPVSSFSNYNQPTETKTPLGKTGIVNLTADNTATAVVANQQFTGSDVYQLDFTFANIKLEVPANQGMVGQQYQAAVTWNLVTGP